MARDNNRAVRDRAFLIAVVVTIAIGFYWRLAYLQRISLHIDEFITILAAQMILEKGIPQLPSGLFYDNGLLFSYVVAAFIGSTGFSEAIARFPSIIFGLLSVAVTFRLGKRFFSPAVALLASALLALAPEAVMWGARSRPYAQLQLWAVVGIWALAEGFTCQWRGRWRALFWLAMVAAALSHLVGVVLMLCSLAAALPARYLWTRREWQGRVDLRRQIRSLWLDGLLTVAVLGGMAALTAAGKPVWIKPITGPASATEGLSLSALIHVDWLDVAYLMAPMLLRPQYLPWTILLLVNLLFLLYRAITRRLRRTDAILLYFQGVWFLSVLALTVGSPWHIPRYVFPLMPVFFLLGSYEMANAIRILSAQSFPRQALAGSPWLAGIIVTLTSILLWAPVRQVTTRQEYGYDLAFRYIQNHWRKEDAIMSFNTPGCYVYLEQCDYYPTQIGAWLLDTPAGPVDRFSGAQWIESVAQLDAALARSPRTWYVIDDFRFIERVAPELQEAILARFQPVFRKRGIQVFLCERELHEDTAR
jgi:4-amino-4-deoxy-L-arabinose transferase-like glycosyltransferase